MGRKIIFNVTKMGASHVKSGKPCQDYSLSWESEDKQVQVAIVCDGHGGDTYVRSDVGARLAAEIALSKIQSFTSSVSPTLFIGKSAAVTARPSEEEDALFPIAKQKKQKDLTESEQQQLEQDEAFYAAVAHIREQDALFVRLFASIYIQWLAEIQKNANEHPFSDEEKACLKNAKLVKAYGTTLMAFVRTPLYWFAFHIGDGKLLSCDRNFNWCEPVPWDCNCFLNMTTSLCNSNPIPLFRYAFSGKGDFPAAVIMGSDGLDDSWGTIEKLQTFYSQTLTIFNDLGEEKAVEELADFLPKLSEKASRDDMSMAGIIDMDEIKEGASVYNIRRKLDTLQQEKNARETELSKLKERCGQLRQDIKTLTADIAKNKEDLSIWWTSLLNTKDAKDNQLQLKENELLKKQKQEEEQCKIYDEKLISYQNWLEKAKKDREELKVTYDNLLKSNESKEKAMLDDWERMKDSFEQQEKLKYQEAIKEKAVQMKQCNDEALKALLEQSDNQESNGQEEVQNDKEQ